MPLRFTEEQLIEYNERKASMSAQIKRAIPDYDLQKYIVDSLEQGNRICPASPFIVTLNLGLKALLRNDSKPKPYERIEQAIALLWLECNAPDAFSVTTANPLGGYRPNGSGGQIKGEGAKLGYPDLLMDKPCNSYHGLRIEMKKYAKSAQPSADQKDWLSKLAAQGYLAVLCRGHQAAISVFCQYLDMSQPDYIPGIPPWAIKQY